MGSAAIDAAIAEHVRQRIDREFAAFAEEVTGEDLITRPGPPGSMAEQAKAAIMRHVAGLKFRRRGPSVLYEAASRLLGVHPLSLTTAKSRAAVDARWAVWSVLKAEGWAANAIGRESHPDRTWNHTTVIAGLGRLAELRASAVDSDRARAERVDLAAGNLRALLVEQRKGVCDAAA